MRRRPIFDSGVDFDPEGGDLYCRNDNRMPPLWGCVRFYAADDQPQAISARRVIRRSYGRLGVAVSSRSKSAAPSHAGAA
jgi:hypothetical protein